MTDEEKTMISRERFELARAALTEAALALDAGHGERMKRLLAIADTQLTYLKQAAEEMGVTEEIKVAVDYAALAERAFARVPQARSEGVADGNDFDLAYSLARQELGGTGQEVDSNALFYALTAQQQKVSTHASEA